MKITISDKISINIGKYTFMELYLPIYSVLMYYRFPAVGSVGQLILYLYLIAYFISGRKKKISIPQYYFVFVLICLPIQIFVFLQFGGLNYNRIINLITVIIYLIILSCFKIDIDNLMRVYFIVALISSLLIILQFVQINVLGMRVTQIMLLPIEKPAAWYSEGLRPTGIFPEPQVYATFILPIIICLIEKRHFEWAMFFSLAILTSTSSLGILCVVGIWIYYMLLSNLPLSIKISILFFFLFGALFVISSGTFNYALNKIQTTDYVNNTRLTRGFWIFRKLPIENKLFGIGMNNLEYWLNSGKIVMSDKLSLSMRDPSYITTIYQLMVQWGMIGFILYSSMLINLLINSKVKILVLLLMVLSIGQTIIFSGVWLFYIMIIMATLKKRNVLFPSQRGMI